VPFCSFKGNLPFPKALRDFPASSLKSQKATNPEVDLIFETSSGFPLILSDSPKEEIEKIKSETKSRSREIMGFVLKI